MLEAAESRGRLRWGLVLAGACALAFALAASRAEAAEALAEWTIAVYLDGDNDLESFAIEDLAEMASVGSTERIRIVVLADMFQTNVLGLGSTRRGEVVKGTFREAWTALEAVPEADMGSPATLTAFVRYARENYPSKRLAVIVWDHGDGWMPPAADLDAAAADRRKEVPLRAVCHDASQGSELSIAQVRAALEAAGPPVDILGFDACLMGMIEVAYELAPCAKTLVASEKSIPGAGWPYELVLEGLAASDDLSARGAATVLVAAYDRRYLGDETLAAVDLAAASEAVSAFDLMLAAVLGTGGAEALVDVAEACLASSPFDYYGYWDFGGLLENLAERASEKPWGSLAGAALAAYRGAVTTLAEHVWPPATGLTIYLPPPGHRPFASYNASTLRFAADTLWPAVLAELAGLPLVDDAFAPNATPATAKEIACGVEYRLRLLGHYDYFRFTASETGRFTAVLRNFPEYADLDLSLLDENGRLLADAATGSATEVVSWSGPAEAKYYLRVEWYDGPPSPYTLEVRTNVDAPEYIVAEGDEAFVSTTGGAILPIAEDDGGLRVELPFQFKFFGREYAAVNVSSNGFLSFGRGVSAYNSMPLPMPGPPTGIVAVWWADLQPRAGTRIIASAEGAAPERAFTITWSNIGIWGSSTEGTITFQASLYEDTNAIVFRYLDTLTGSERDDFGASAAVGLQAEGSHSAVLYSFREPVLRNGLSLRFMPVRGLFVRGDASRDGRVDVGDAVTVLSQVFLNAPVKCADASDANDDGVINIADAIRLLGRLFADGPPLPPPYPEPGTDPTPDGLDCADA